MHERPGTIDTADFLRTYLCPQVNKRQPFDRHMHFPLVQTKLQTAFASPNILELKELWGDSSPTMWTS